MAKVLDNGYLRFRAGDVHTELRQLEDEGRDTAPVRRRLRRLAALGDEELFLPENQEKLGRLLDEAQTLKMR